VKGGHLGYGAGPDLPFDAHAAAAHTRAFREKIMPFIGAPHAHQTLTAVEMDHPTIEVGIYAAFLPEHHPAAKVRAFIDFLVGHYAPKPPWDRA